MHLLSGPRVRFVILGGLCVAMALLTLQQLARPTNVAPSADSTASEAPPQEQESATEVTRSEGNTSTTDLPRLERRKLQNAQISSDPKPVMQALAAALKAKPQDTVTGDTALPAPVDPNLIPKPPKLSEAQLANLARLRWGESKDLRYRGDSDNATVRSLHASVLAKAESGETDAAKLALGFITENRALFLLSDPGKELTVSSRTPDPLGGEVVRMEQRHQGLRVWPTGLTANVNEHGLLTTVTGNYAPTPTEVSLTPTVTTAQAEVAVAAYAAKHGFGEKPEVEEPELLVFSDPKRSSELAYKYSLSSGEHGAGAHQHHTVVVSAQSGEVLLGYSEICNAAVQGQGVDLNGQVRQVNAFSEGNPVGFYLVDTTKPMFNPITLEGRIHIYDEQRGNATVSSSSLVAGWDPHAVSAAFNLSKVYDFYLSTFGRNSYDNQGSSLQAIVGLPTEQNASWSGAYKLFRFGRGDKYSAASDVIGHEFSHAVISSTADLIYEYEAGALNESFADILGESFERNLQGAQDWLIGATLNQGALRSFTNPESGDQPRYMSRFLRTTSDYGGVHTNSGIPNHAFYLLAEGRGSGSIGFTKARDIFYRALTTKLNKSSGFHDLRDACVQSAGELFGAGSVEVIATGAAFSAVEIYGNTPADPLDLNPVPGAPSLLFTRLHLDDQYYLYRYEEAQGDTLSAPRKISDHAVNVNSRITVSEDGKVAAYVSADHDIVLVNPLAGTSQKLGYPGTTNSIAFSPDGKHVAVVIRDTASGVGEPEVNYLNVDTDTFVTFTMAIPTTGQGQTIAIDQVDEISISPNGESAIVDALTKTTVIGLNGQSETFESWSVVSLDLRTGGVVVLGGPFKELNVGHPSYARTSAFRVAFEAQYIAPASGAGAFTVDLRDLETVQEVESAPSNPAYFYYPSFSSNDSQLVYTQTYPYLFFWSRPRLAVISLMEDNLSPTGAASTLSDPSHNGVVYTRGTYVGPANIAVTVPNATVPGGGSGVIRFSRISGDTTQAVPLSFKLTGTARPELHYPIVSTFPTIPANQTYVDVVIQNRLTPFSGSVSLTATLDRKGHYIVSETADAAVMTLTPPPLTYTSWAEALGVGAGTADPDVDGRSNFIEYVLGSDPTVAEGSYTSVETFDSGIQRFLQVRVVRSRVTPGLTWTLERSADRVAWSSAHHAVVADTATELVVRDAVPLNAGEVRYLRLRFSDGSLSDATSSKGFAVLTLGSLAQVYSGSARVATVSGVPTGATVSLLYNGSSAAPSAAGDYLVTATLQNSDLIGSGQGTLRISPAVLIVRADDKTRTVGMPNPTLTLTFTGFVGSDGIGSITPPVPSVSATVASPPGIYAITLSGGSATNYTLQLVNGTLTILDQIPSPPSGVNASDDASDQVNISWQASVNATGYLVFRSPSSNLSNAIQLTLTPVNGTAFADTSAEVGTVYHYFVRALGSAGQSDASASDSGVRVHPLMRGLLVWMEFNGNTTDGSRFGRSVTASSVSYRTDRRGVASRAASLAGANSSLTLPSADDLNLTEWTLALWVRPSATSTASSDGSVYLVTKGTSPNYSLSWVPSTGLLRTAISTTTGAKRSLESTGSLLADRWTHVAASFSPVAGGTLTLYLDGVVKGSSSSHGVPATNSATLQLFASALGGGYAGGVDDLRLYNRSLTASEMEQLAESGASAPGAGVLGTEVDLGANWRRSTWFGDYYRGASFPWVYHAQHGWLYLSTTSTGGVFLYDTVVVEGAPLGWLYTTPTFYPRVYSTRFGWLYYHPGGTPQLRWFYQYNGTRWLRARDKQ